MKNWEALLSFCVFIKNFKTIKESGKVMLKTRKGWLEARASHMSRVWIVASTSNIKGFRSIIRFFVSQDGKFILPARRLGFADDPNCCIPWLRKRAWSELFPSEKPGV